MFCFFSIWIFENNKDIKNDLSVLSDLEFGLNNAVSNLERSELFPKNYIRIKLQQTCIRKLCDNYRLLFKFKSPYNMYRCYYSIPNGACISAYNGPRSA